MIELPTLKPVLETAIYENMVANQYTSLLPVQQDTLVRWLCLDSKCASDIQALVTRDYIRNRLLSTATDNMFIASCTGSGKTLASLLPIAIESSVGLFSTVMFACPTKLLVQQHVAAMGRLFHGSACVRIVEAAEMLDRGLFRYKFVMHPVTGLTEERFSQHVAKCVADERDRAFNINDLLSRCSSRIRQDCTYILVGTPGMLTSLLISSEYYTTLLKNVCGKDATEETPFVFAMNNQEFIRELRLATIIVDEVDYLLSHDTAGFLSTARNMLAMASSPAVFQTGLFLSIAPYPTTHFVFLSASMQYRASLLANINIHGGTLIDYSDMTLKTKGKHLSLPATLSHYSLRLLDLCATEIDIAYLLYTVLTYRDNKNAVSLSAYPYLPAIVFCNTLKSVTNLARVLMLFNRLLFGKMRISLVMLGKDTPVVRKGFNLSATITEDILDALKKPCIILATDAYARGVDIPQLKTAVSYELPRDLTSLYHRLGRVARTGNEGTGISFVRSTSEDNDADIADCREELASLGGMTCTYDVRDCLTDLLSGSKGGLRRASAECTADDLRSISDRLQDLAHVLSIGAFYDSLFESPDS